MKKIVALLLICCLTLGLATAYAAGPKITKQPEFGKSKTETTVVIEIKAKSYKGLTWRFVNPDTGEELTAKELAKAFDGIKVKNPNKAKITLEKVPAELNGWEVYCHLSGNGYQVDSERLTIDLGTATEPVAEATAAPAPEAVPEASEPAEEPAEVSAPAEPAVESAPAEVAAEPAAEPVPAEDEGEGFAEPDTITVTGENVTLVSLDSFGRPNEENSGSSLTFTEFGSVEARADGEVEYWIINGIRVTPDTDVSSFKLQNITSDMTIAAVAPDPEDVQLNSGDRVQVVCSGCRFTYMADNLVSVTAGSVPRGADIIVMADSTTAAAGGYSINGGEFAREGKISFRLTVTEDTEIKTK